MDCRTALLTVLDQVDYTKKMCSVSEPVGAIIPKEVIELARQAIKDESADKSDRYEKMKGFIHALSDDFYPDCGDINGGDFQEIAEKYGILVPEIHHKPCGEFCNCNEMVYDEEWKDGVKCYRLASWLVPQQKEDGEHG